MKLLLSTPELDTETLHQLTLDCCRTINAETELEARVAEEAPRPGAKGDPVTIGAIVLAFVTSGAAAKLCGVLSSYFERSSTLEVAFERGDGQRISVKAENLAPGRVDETLGLLRQFMGASA